MCKDGAVREHDWLKEPGRFDKQWVWGLRWQKVSLAGPDQCATGKDFRWGSEECGDLFPDRLWQVCGGLPDSVRLERPAAFQTELWLLGYLRRA